MTNTDPAFEPVEYADRLGRVHLGLARDGLDALFVIDPSNQV